MATKIGVLDLHQRPSDIPRVFLKKSVAKLLVRRLLAEEIRYNLIRMLPAPKARTASDLPAPVTRYIPEKMPPLNVPGVWFQEPQSDQWKKDHKTVSFMR